MGAFGAASDAPLIFKRPDGGMKLNKDLRAASAAWLVCSQQASG
jgi:hypothetical protein